jgi:hypothetical protein
LAELSLTGEKAMSWTEICRIYILLPKAEMDCRGIELDIP